MDRYIHSVVEDLLPLYNEGLLSEDTVQWFKQQVENSEELQKLVGQSATPLIKEEIASPIQHDKMMANIQRRLSIYQLIFVGLSFYLAINTSMLNESFGFVLWYAVLGVVTYLFYKDMKIVFLLTFIPIFIWSVGSNLSEYMNGHIDNTITFSKFILQSLAGSFMITLIHYIFALIGSVIGLLFYKIKGESK